MNAKTILFFSSTNDNKKKKKLTFQKILENRNKNENIKTNIQMCFYNKQIKFQFTFLKILQFNLLDIS